MRRLLFAALVFAPLAAAADGRPSYFVAERALTVRAAPGRAAEPVGRIAAGTAPIEISAETDGWGRIAWRGVDGWAPLSALKPREVARLEVAHLPLGLVCGGTEPFWSLAFGEPGEAVFATPAGAGPAYHIAGGAVAEGRLDFPVALSLEAQGENAVAVIRPLACSDGMSDMTHPWTLELLTQSAGETGLLTGCCRLPIPD